MYCEYSVIIPIILKIFLQDSLGLVLVMILIILFCIINTLCTLVELPQKIIP
jgi:hypothetical protein